MHDSISIKHGTSTNERGRDCCDSKRSKYAAIEQTHDFIPVALETLSPMSASAVEFVDDIGRKVTEVTSDPRETQFLFQRLSVAIQRFNVVCLADTFRDVCESSS